MRERRQQRFPAAVSLGVVARAAALIAVTAGLSSCTPDKSADLATCEKETLRFFSGSAGDEFTIACMDAKGYRFEVLPSDCDGKSRMARQPACYVPNGWLAGFFDGLGRPSKSKADAQTRPPAPGTKPAQRSTTETRGPDPA
jgi:hypothetical protein